VERLQNFFNQVSLLDAIVLVGLIVIAIVTWFSGIAPALWRLGNGLAQRKVAIFARNENLGSLRDLLVRSRLFKSKNIIEIQTVGDLAVAEDASVYVMYWPDWSNGIELVLEKKRNSIPMIIYAPFENGRIPDETMGRIDGHRHTAVTNFRGRLLNDILTAMITTSYEKR
jgi:hypothetical protein